jgi:ATP synthase protein I
MRLSTDLIDLAQPKRVNPTQKLTNWQEYTKIAAHFNNHSQMGAAYRVISLQAILVVFVTALLFFLLGKEAAQAFFFGGAVAVANALFLAWGLRAGVQRPVQDVRQELTWLVSFSIKRFFMVALLIVAGLGWLKLMPVPLLIGFVLGQLTLVVSTMISGIEKV